VKPRDELARLEDHAGLRTKQAQPIGLTPFVVERCWAATSGRVTGASMRNRKQPARSHVEESDGFLVAIGNTANTELFRGISTWTRTG